MKHSTQMLQLFQGDSSSGGVGIQLVCGAALHREGWFWGHCRHGCLEDLSPFAVVQLLSLVWLFRSLMDCSTPGSSVHGISQARMLEWAAISSSRESSRPRGWSRVSWVACTGQEVSLLLAPPGKPHFFLCALPSFLSVEPTFWPVSFSFSLKNRQQIPSVFFFVCLRKTIYPSL